MSWFHSVWKFFGRLSRGRNNRTTVASSASPDDPLTPRAVREELIRCGKEMKEKSRNRMSLREMKKLKSKREKMKMLTKSKIEERGQTQDDDEFESQSGVTELSRGQETPEASISDMSSSGLQNESENHDQSEVSDIAISEMTHEDPNEKEEIGNGNVDTDSDVSSKLDSSERSHEDVESKSEEPPKHPILDKDEFSDTGEEVEGEDDSSRDSSDHEEERSGGQACEVQSSTQSKDRDSESGIELDTQNNNLHEVCENRDSESAIVLEGDDEEKVRGRRRVSEESFYLKKVRNSTLETSAERGVILSVYNAKTIGRKDYDVTPKTSYEQVGNPKSVGVSNKKLPGMKSCEEKTSRTEKWAEQSVAWRSVVSSDSNNEYNDLTQPRAYYVLQPEKFNPIRERQYSKIIEPVKKSLNTQVKVRVTSSEEDKVSLEDDRFSGEEKSEKASSEVEKATDAAKKSSSVRLLLRRGFHWVGSKMPKKTGIGIAEPAPAVKPKSKKPKGQSRRSMRSSPDDTVSIDQKRVEMLSCLKEAKVMARTTLTLNLKKGENLSDIYGGVLLQPGGGRRAPLE